MHLARSPQMVRLPSSFHIFYPAPLTAHVCKRFAISSSRSSNTQPKGCIRIPMSCMISVSSILTLFGTLLMPSRSRKVSHRGRQHYKLLYTRRSALLLPTAVALY